MNLAELIAAVEDWAEERSIFLHSNKQAQLMKTVSELGELADATLKNDGDGILDGVGDVLVTLIIYSALHGITLQQALSHAYEQIKDRRGTLTPEGVFVKQE